MGLVTVNDSHISEYTVSGLVGTSISGSFSNQCNRENMSGSMRAIVSNLPGVGDKMAERVCKG